MGRRAFLTLSGAAIAAVATASPAFARAPQADLAPSIVSQAARKHKPKPAINELNRIFKEAEAVVEWPKGYYRDVYTRIVETSQKLIDTTSAEINPQLAKDAGILNRQAQAMLAEEDAFESENRPAQLENRYTRVDMQLWRDRLAFDSKNPFNDQKATTGIKPAVQSPAPATLKDLEVYSDNAGRFTIDYKVIPAGAYEMGGNQAEWESPDVDEYRRGWESPEHMVNIRKRFGIMPTEVNRAMFAQFV